jgi:hypothetical protein
MRTVYVQIENADVGIMTMQLSGQDDRDACRKALDMQINDRQRYPDTAIVGIYTMRQVEYKPPRCRKTRIRLEKDLLATFTLGELRQEPVP